MNSSTHLILISITILPLLLLLYIPSSAVSQPEFLSSVCALDYGNYTTNSTFNSNLHKLLSSITSNTQINYGFYNLSVGQNMDRVAGVALCRGDIPTHDCLTCIRHASTKITQDCPYEKTAIGVYPKCMIWYSNSNMFKGLPVVFIYQNARRVINGGIRNQKSFNSSISNLLMGLASKASAGDYRRKFATGEAQVNNKQKVYALLQCIPDMEEYDCWECFNIVVNYTLGECCYATQAAWVVGLSCSVRYDTYKFYGSPTVLPPLTSPSPLPLPSPPTPSITIKKGNKSKKFEVVAIILIPTAALVLLVILAACYFFRRTRKPITKIENDDEEETTTIESLHMDFGIVKSATDNFSTSNKIGHGGFGTVYKGKLSNGQDIAVKRLNKNSGHGKQEFKNEAMLMAKLQHRNLVKFLGFCTQKDEKLLIFELLPNKSLNYFLFDPNNHVYLDWQKRYKIIQGIARGLLYLHEESRLLVVHRDLKPSNILLDLDLNPKISDFGMARLFGVDQSHANTKKIVGTYGYMPPEYVIHGQFSIKSDVFSFGVLVLEIVSGQKVSEFSQEENGDSLLNSAWRCWLEGDALSLVDSTMLGVNTTEVLRCINIGLLCVQENAVQRPIMSSVVLMLNSYTVTLPVPSRPAFLVQNDADSELK